MNKLLKCTTFCLVVVFSLLGSVDAYFIFSKSPSLKTRPPVRAPRYDIHSSHIFRSTKAEKGPDMNPYEILSTVGQGGYVPVYLVKKFLGSKAITKFVGHNAALFYALFGTMDVLGSAYKRNRLDGTTFKYLNLGVFASSVIYLANTYKSLSTMASNPGEILGAVLIFLSGVTAATKLSKHGLPDVKKLKMKGEKGCCPFSSKLFLLSGITTLVSALRSLFTGVSAFGTPIGALQLSVSCALLPIISLVEHQAVLARRMDSKTYKDLNWILLLVSAISILTAPSSTFTFSALAPTVVLKSIDKPLFIVSSVSTTLAALLGLQIGYFGPDK